MEGQHYRADVTQARGQVVEHRQPRRQLERAIVLATHVVGRDARGEQARAHSQRYPGPAASPEIRPLARLRGLSVRAGSHSGRRVHAGANCITRRLP